MTTGKTGFSKSRWFHCVLMVGVGLAAALAVGCGSDNGPTAPAETTLLLTNAEVVVDGQTLNGQTLPRGHGGDASTRFQARLHSEGHPSTGLQVWVEYERPGGMGMMNSGGRFRLYDDGTHGDPVAGDGIYCYEDWVGDYGCHSVDAEPGEYHWEFHGEDGHGHESNHMLVTVTIVE